MSAFGYCAHCRGERLRATLVFDPETGRVRCSNRAACEVDRRIRSAREKAREAADAADPTGASSLEMVSRLVPVAEETAADRERRRNRERMASIRAARAERKTGGQ